MGRSLSELSSEVVEGATGAPRWELVRRRIGVPVESSGGKADEAERTDDGSDSRSPKTSPTKNSRPRKSARTEIVHMERRSRPKVRPCIVAESTWPKMATEFGLVRFTEDVQEDGDVQITDTLS